MLGSSGSAEQQNGPEVSALISKGASSALGQNKTKGRPWCEHCKKPGHTVDKCWVLHGKPAYWKPRQINRNRGYQAGVDVQNESASTSSEPFNSEQIEQLYKIFSSLQATGQSGSNIATGSLAHRGNFFTNFKCQIAI